MRNPKVVEIKEVNGFVFDLDGTLVNSFPGHVESWTRAITEFGVSATEEEIRSQMGKSSRDISKALMGGASPAELEEASRRKDQIYLKIIPGFLEAKEGSRETLVELRERGYEISVASSNPRDVIQRSLKTVRLAELTGPLASQDEVNNGKPAPDMFLLASQKMGIEGRRCAAVGDTVYDIESARGAEMLTVAYTGGCNERSQLEDGGPDFIISDLRELLDIFPSRAGEL